MRINEQLNLVIPLMADDGSITSHVYHMPVSREVFERHYRVLSATHDYLASKGTHFRFSTGPRIATLTLKDEGRRDAVQRGYVDKDGKVSEAETDAFLLEIRRLTTILAPGPNGYETLPIDTAMQRGLLDEEDWRETESILVFFTLQYALAPRAQKAEMARVVASLMKAATTSSTPMEFLNSLPTLTKVASIAAQEDSSVPC
jgi:hypothetical protein